MAWEITMFSLLEDTGDKHIRGPASSDHEKQTKEGTWENSPNDCLTVCKRRTNSKTVNQTPFNRIKSNFEYIQNEYTQASSCPLALNISQNVQKWPCISQSPLKKSYPVNSRRQMLSAIHRVDWRLVVRLGEMVKPGFQANHRWHTR